MQRGADRIARAKTLILFGMGVYLTLLMVTGNTRQLHQSALRLAGCRWRAALLPFGARKLLQQPQCKAQCEHDHHHYHITWDIVLVVAFPLLLAILIPSRSLGIEAVNGGVSLSPVGVAWSEPQPARSQYPGLAARIRPGGDAGAIQRDARRCGRLCLSRALSSRRRLHARPLHA